VSEHTQVAQIDLGINRGCPYKLMPQNFSNFGQACSTTEHPARKRMAKHMRAGGSQTGALKSVMYDAADC